MNILLYVMFTILAVLGLISLACAVYTFDSILFLVAFFLLASSGLVFSEIRKFV